MALVTLEQAKAALGIDPADTSQDAALTAQIEAVSIAANNYCGRIFVVQSYQDTMRHVYNWLYAGEPLRTRQFPIVVSEGEPLVAVIENGAVVDVSLWEVYPEEGALYRLEPDRFRGLHDLHRDDLQPFRGPVQGVSRAEV